MDYSRVHAVLPTAQARLFAIPGVHTVGIGTKIIAGEFTDEPAIMVFVTRKRPLAELDPNEVIPAEIDGIKTDVYESSLPRPHVAPDDSNYKEIRGGIQIEPGGLIEAVASTDGGVRKINPGHGLGGLGTLGFFVDIAAPNPSVHAVTCYHVVGMPLRGLPTNLTITIPTQRHFTFSIGGDSTVTPGTLVVVSLLINETPTPITRYAAFHAAGDSDTPISMIHALIGKINGLGHSLNATGDGTAILQIASTVAIQLLQVTVNAHGPAEENPLSKLHAKIDGTTITFTGRAEQDCGAFVNVNVGGAHGTAGGYALIPKDMLLTFLAQEVAQIIEGFHLPGVTVDPPTDTSVKVNGVHHVECTVSADIRVGQPTNEFHTSRCLRCCDRRIGQTAYGRLDLDVATIRLDANLVYRSEIEDIGAITGTHDVTNDPGGTQFWKRGRTTRVTQGALLAHSASLTYGNDFIIEDDEQNDPPQWHLFNRFFTNAFVVKGDGFSDGGDSGAAVVTTPVTGSDGSKTTTIAGLLFGGTRTTHFVTPITDILKTLSTDFGVTVTLDTSTKVGVDKSAPADVVDTSALMHVSHRDVTPVGSEVARLAQVERQLVATPGGQYYSALIMRHLTEAQALVNTNRRMATVWHRNGGPAIIESILRMLQIPGQRVPGEINGMPLMDCLQQIASGLARYGSEGLATDLAAHGPAIMGFFGYSYPELLVALKKPVAA